MHRLLHGCPGLFSVRTRWLLVAVRILIAYAFLFLIIPPVVRQWLPRGDLLLIPTSLGQYTLAAVVASVLLFTVVLILMQRRPARVGLRSGRASFRAGLVGAALLCILVAVTALLYPGLARGQAEALGLVTRWDFLIHMTWYAWVWSAFREEFFYRGFAQTMTQECLPGSWGLLVPLLFFSSAHLHNAPSLLLGLVWVFSTLPGGLVFTALYFNTGSITAPVLAHALNNSVAGLVTGVAIFNPEWLLPSCIMIVGGGCALLIWQRGLLVELVRDTGLRLRRDFAGGIGRGVLMLTVLILGTLALRRHIPL